MQLKQTHKQYGLITGLAIVVIGLILYVADLSFESWAQYVMYVPFLVGLIINANAFSKANDGYVTFGKTFSSCFKAAAIATLLVLAWSFLSLYLFPDTIEKGMEAARNSMAEQGMSDEQIEQSMSMARKYFKVFMIGGVVFWYMFVGAIFSLIAAAIAKKKGDMPPSMQAQ